MLCVFFLACRAAMMSIHTCLHADAGQHASRRVHDSGPSTACVGVGQHMVCSNHSMASWQQEQQQQEQHRHKCCAGVRQGGGRGSNCGLATGSRQQQRQAGGSGYGGREGGRSSSTGVSAAFCFKASWGGGHSSSEPQSPCSRYSTQQSRPTRPWIVNKLP